MGALDAVILRNVTLSQAKDENTVQTGSYIHSQPNFCNTTTLQIKRALTL